MATGKKNVLADLLIIDPQVDFCDPKGSLHVSGADEDCKRLATMINRVSRKLNDIHVTLDTHRFIHIAHPVFWWSDSLQKHPDPFTLITKDSIKKGEWRPFIPSYMDWVLHYTETLEKNHRYVLCIWPPHCLIGSNGYKIYPEVFESLNQWERTVIGNVDFVTKGSNFKTEHYSAVQADVADPDDSGTLLNTSLINVLQTVDVIGISGQALSHCVANTITDIADNFGEDNIKKFVLIEDTCSNVTGFEQLGKDFVKNMVARGMQVCKSTEFLA